MRSAYSCTAYRARVSKCNVLKNCLRSCFKLDVGRCGHDNLWTNDQALCDYSPRAPPAGSGGASVVRGISQSCAGETFGYAAQERSQRSQTCRVDAPWYGTRAMQVTTSRGQNCARRALFCVSALCPLAPTPFDEISRNLVHGYSSTRAFKICIS